MKRLRTSVKKARKHGYDIRPTDHRKLSKAKARSLLRINAKLFEQCRTHVIQKAVDQGGQQRPRRRDAGPLPRAALAQAADVRPGLRTSTRPSPTAATPARCRTTTSSTAPTTRTWSRSSAAGPTPGQAAEPAAHGPARHPQRRHVHPLQPPARGLRRQRRRRHRRGRRRLAPATAGPRRSGTRRTSASSSTAPTASCCAT